MLIPPYRICLSGGGIKGLAHIGALEVLHEKGLLRSVREYIGISAGALCAFALCVGCSLTELRMVIELLDFGHLRHLEPETILQFPEQYGLDSGENLMKLTTAILRAKNLPPTITFEELSRRAVGPNLRMFCTNLNTCFIEELSAACSPTMEVRQGLQASMCIPLYFQPVKNLVTGHYLVDGGLICHSPLKFLKAEEIEGAVSITFSDDHKHTDEIGDLYSFLRQIYYSSQYHLNKELAEDHLERTIFLRCGAFHSLNFEIKPDEKVALMQAGREGAETFLAGLRQRLSRPPRRFSVG
jgi:predicted acylesterase/phospholipase RssA